MRNLVTFLMTALCFFWQTSNCEDYSSCGLRAVYRGKIFGGLQSRPGMWPWQVAIFRRTNAESQKPQFFCGGALLNSRWVLSAAHCFHKRPHEKYIDYRYTIKVGEHKILSKDPHEQERTAFRIHNHPNFIPSTYENDIALIELNKGVKMGPNVRSICLPRANEKLSSPGEIVKVAGWGFTTKGSHSSVLLHSAFEIKGNKKCEDTTRYLFNETVMFCAGHGEGGNDTCKGDSGGSTVREVLRDGRRRWVTVGLVSWGEGCGIRGKYGYYTRVGPFVDWIHQKVNGSILSCDHLGNIPNGRIIGSDFLVGFTVRYTCNEGYHLRGRSTSRCERNGKWTVLPSCKRVECKNPVSPLNGIGIPQKKKYYYKDKIRFRCKTNYTMIGRSEMVCHSDGMWNGFIPACLAPCEDPGIPQGGIRLDHSFKHGQTVRFMCTKKNQPPTLSYLICNNGKWHQNVPRCIADCDDPGIPVNGQKQGNDFTINRRVYFTCDRGYMRVGPEYLECQSNRRWSDKAPTCEALSCTRPTPPENAHIFSTRQPKDKYGFNEVVMFQCNRGYRSFRSPFVKCLTNGWSNTNLRCPPKNCGDPGTPANGRKQGDVFTFNSKVNFTCAVGYEVKGSAHRVCQQNGTWSGTGITCERVECRDLGTPRNGVRRPDKNKYLYEDRIYFRCHTNYSLRGDTFITCLSDRTWTGTVPRCLAPCKDPGIPVGGRRNQHSFLHKKVVQFQCKRGWSMEGSRTTRCNDGRWDHDPPTCKKECSRPNKYPANGGIYGSSSSYVHKTSIRYYCHGGYNLVGLEYVRCLNGTWQNRQPTCTRCTSALGMENGKIPDGYIQTSTSRWGYHAKDGRLNGPKAWCSGSEREPYLQIDFRKPYNITGVATQGSAYNNKWVEHYTVSSNLAGSAFTTYREDNRDKIFIGNTDKDSVVERKFKHPVIGRRLRIYPHQHERFSYACIRVEIYGCDLASDCIVIGSRVVSKWVNYRRGISYKYYKAYLTNINGSYWRVDLENEHHGYPRYKLFSKYDDIPFVLDVPPKHEELHVGTRVLARLGYTYYTSTITTIIGDNRYRVRADDGDKYEFTLDKIRLLKAPIFCN